MGAGALAAERVFYVENSNGVGGDIQSMTAQAAYMVLYAYRPLQAQDGSFVMVLVPALA
jgi:hypothetical protein